MRVERIGECELWLGDCRELLGEIPEDAAIVSDVPYGINYSKGESGTGIHRNRHVGKALIISDDRPFDPTHLLTWPCILFGANHYAKRLPDGGAWHAWDKNVGNGPADDFADVEFIWTSWKRKSVVIRYLWKGVLRQHNDGSPRYHVSEKPVPVMQECISWLPDDALTIADPYCGSGTTGVACARLGRRFIGIELDPGHFETACRRIEQAYRQPRLFAEPAPKPQQMALVP